MNKTGFLAVLCGALCSLAGCSLAPEYKTPEIPIPQNFKEAAPWQLAIPADDQPRGDWYTYFGDPVLNDLEGRLAHGNLDLTVALARYDAVRNLAAEAGAALFPEIDMAGSATRNRQSEGRPLRGSNQPNTYNAYTLGAGFNYEVDLWGRVRNQISATRSLAEASRADVESVRLSLQAELANSYFLLRGLDAQGKLLADTVEAYRRQVELIDNRHKEGIVSGVDVSRAQTQLQEVRAQVADNLARRAIYEHGIATLIGESASVFSLPPALVNTVQPEIPVGIPSTLLLRRPDIAAAERRVAAANAQVGVARAAFFPSILLGAGGGYQNTAAAALLTSPNTFWSIGPTAVLALFDAGRREAIVARARAQTEEMAAHYRATVLQAFKEVEDNLVLIRRQREEKAALSQAVASAGHTYALSMNRYREGAVNYLEVVDAEAAKLRTEQAALDVTTRGLLSTVNLVRALGGTWVATAAPLAEHHGEAKALQRTAQ